MKADPSRSNDAAAPPGERSIASSHTPRIRRLIADQRYFGLEALAFHAGAQRMLARSSRQPQIDMKSLAEDFGMDADATRMLVRALLSGALLHPDGTGAYRATERFREYALACVVAPLSRERAKSLIGDAREAAKRVNADWARNPYVIWTIAVSGGYMSRHRRLHELSLWLILRRRPQSRRSRWRPMLRKDDALREIVSAMKALSSFVVVRIAPDRDRVQRPFNVVFETIEETVHPQIPPWEWLREWTASISRRLSPKPPRAAKTELLSLNERSRL